MNTYQRGEIVSKLSEGNNMTYQDVATLLDVNRSTTLRLAQIFEFANEIPAVEPTQVLSKVGIHNIRWLSTKSRSDFREEIQDMINDECAQDEIQSRIVEMKDAVKSPAKPSKADQLEARIHELEAERDKYKAWFEEELVCKNATMDVIDNLLDELEELSPMDDEKEFDNDDDEVIVCEAAQHMKDSLAAHGYITREEVTANEQETIKDEEVKTAPVMETPAAEEEDPLAFLNRPINALARFRQIRKEKESQPVIKKFQGHESEDEAFIE
jgi:hypothetical protein